MCPPPYAAIDHARKRRMPRAPTCLRFRYAMISSFFQGGKASFMQFIYLISSQRPDENTIFLVLASLIMSAAAGAIVHRVMGRGSFGPIGNMVLILFAIVMAQWINPQRMGLAINHDAMRIAILSAAIATLMLATLGMLKTWLGRPR